LLILRIRLSLLPPSSSFKNAVDARHARVVVVSAVVAW
jgi:hypothetical protein